MPVRIIGEHDPAQVRCGAQCQPVGRLARQLRERGFESLGDVDVQHLAGGDQQPNIGQSHDFGDLCRRVQRAQRYDERAGPRHGEPPDDPLHAVGEEQADTGALADTFLQKPTGDLRRTLLGLFVCEAVSRCEQVGVLAELACAALEERGDGRSWFSHPPIFSNTCLLQYPRRRRTGLSARGVRAEQIGGFGLVGVLGPPQRRRPEPQIGDRRVRAQIEQPLDQFEVTGPRCLV